MADVETPLETKETVVSKTVETTVTEKEGTTVIVEETTTVVEVNGDHNNLEKTTEVDTTVKTNDENVTETPKPTENGDTAKSEEETAVESEEAKPAAEGEADKVEEKKEEVIPKVILHQFPPSKDLPSLSLFCLKLETYLRLNKIPYENQYGYKFGKKGKMPWIEYKGERKNDSSFIIDYLKEKFEVTLDDELSDEQHALGRLVQVTLEENSYWAMCYNRIIENYNDYKKVMTPASGGGIGFNVAVKMQQRKTRNNLDGHGIGRHSPEEIHSIAEKDIKAVSTILGDKEYLLGDKVSTYDCTAFGFFANILWSGIESPMSTYIKENAKNIIGYCDRMKETAWPDWCDMVLGDKPEPAIKKGFSFRKKKAKPAKKEKEPEKENETEEAKPAEENKEEAAPEEENKTEEAKPDEESKPTEEAPAEEKQEAAPNEESETPKEE